MMITSKQNPLVKEIQMFQKKKKERNKEGVFVVEGLRAVKEVPKTWPVHKYVVAESFIGEAQEAIGNHQAPLIEVSDGVFDYISDTKTPQGIMALVAQANDSLDEIVSIKDGFFMIADQVQDPGNLGSLIRTAHASGAHGVFLSKGCVDLYNPKTIRATMGSIFHIPIFIEMDIKEMIERLTKEGTHLYATSLEESRPLYAYDYRKKTAIIIGNEANGIGDTSKNLVPNFIKIPMPGGAESLNASIAASICMFEVVRQRFY